MEKGCALRCLRIIIFTLVDSRNFEERQQTFSERSVMLFYEIICLITFNSCRHQLKGMNELLNGTIR